MGWHEVNFDGLVGPTHHYGGLARGNLPSLRSRGEVSSPRRAALQGLDKMKLLAGLGVKQAVLPPHERPDLRALRGLGFTGSDARVLERALADAPELLSACSSASSMWAANAATVSPSPDTADGRLHLSPANLCAHLHRSLEAPMTAALFERIFRDPAVVSRHEPLPATPLFADEGAANHLRLAPSHGAPGIEVFVHGRAKGDLARPTRFHARQSHEASRALARRHAVARAIFVAESPAAIDAGAFHADVVAVANENVLVFHADAFAERDAFIAELRRAWDGVGGGELVIADVRAEELSLDEAVASYFFNSQLVTLPDGGMALVVPEECGEIPRAAACIRRLLERASRIRAVYPVALRQSMRNGGGPACFRLRIVLSEAELAVVHPGVLLDAALERELRAWVERRFREELRLADLADPRLLLEIREALDEVTRILGLGSLYAFQRE